ncbi:MAG: hypothetical protein ABFD54_04510 [Armatimonadota bacterium]
MQEISGLTKLLTDAGPAISTVAVILVTILFLRFLGEERRDRATERDADRDSRAKAHEQFTDTLKENNKLVTQMVETCKARRP